MSGTTTNTRKPIWVFETYDKPLKVKSEEGKDNEYIFSGPCAEFNAGLNENEREYDKDDYCSHLEYLLPEIKENSLLGELDHPEGYVPSMKSVSHMIKDLWFDEGSNQMMIKIKLIPTRDGKDAMAIADAGAPLYISSRASGFIDDDGKVTLEKIYTYDIVYRPGFRNAKLKKATESHNRKHKSSSVAIYERAEQSINNNNKQQESHKMEFVTKEDFNKYTESIEKMFGGLKTLITESKNSGIVIAAGKNDFSSKAKKLNENADAKEDKALLDKLNVLETNMKDHGVDKEAIFEFLTMVRKKVNGHSVYMNEMAKFNNKMADHTDLITERLNNISNYVNMLAKRMNELADFSEATGKTAKDDVAAVTERLNKTSKYMTLVAERSNGIEKYTKVLTTGMNETRETVNKIATKKVNEAAKPVSARTQAIKNKMNESKDKPAIPYKKGNITKLTESVLESVKKKKTDESQSLLESNYPFIKRLDTPIAELFSRLDEVKKKEISNMISEKKVTLASEVVEVIKSVNEASSPLYLMLTTMPKKSIKVWESFTKPQRNKISSLFLMKGIKNPAEAEMFWEEVDLGDSKSIKLNEEDSLYDVVPTLSGVNELGYADEDIEKSLSL